MAHREQKVRKAATGEWMYCTISARPDEIASWRGLADAVDRSLSWWIRDQLNKAVQSAIGASHENKTLEDVSANRPVDHLDRG